MQRVGNDGDCRRRNDHHDHRQTHDRADLAFEIAQRKQDRARVKQRRNEHEEQDFRRQRHLRQTRNQSQ